MSNVIHKIAPRVWAILTYEDSWKSYINNYVVAKGNSFLLIDTNLRKHRTAFQNSLKEIGAVSDRIEHVYCTHRHPDHIGNIELFPSRNNWIHLEDYFELDDFSQTLFGHTFTGSGGEVPHLRFVHLPLHTNGSVAFFDEESGVCFIGDHLHFFGHPLGEGFGFAPECRQTYLTFVRKWSAREPKQMPPFVEGLRAVIKWSPRILATGHGPILKGDVTNFLKQVADVATTASP